MHRELLPSQLSTGHTRGNAASRCLGYHLPFSQIIRDGTRSNLDLKTFDEQHGDRRALLHQKTPPPPAVPDADFTKHGKGQ